MGSRRVSLAGRVLLIAFSVLFLPLLILFFFLYFDDLHVKREQTKLTLNLNADHKFDILCELIENERNVLKMVSEGKLLSPFSEIGCGEFVFRVVEDVPCDDNLRLMDGTKVTLWLGDKSGALYVVYKDVTNVLWAGWIGPEEFMPKLKVEPDRLRPIQMALANNGVVVDSTCNKLIGKNLGRMVSVDSFVEEKVVSTVRTVENISMVMWIPVSVDFVDVPFFVVKLFIVLLVVLLAGGVVLWIVVRKLSSPLHSIIALMESVSNGDFEARFSPKPFGFELNRIGLALNATLSSLVSSMQRTQHEIIKRELYEKELSLGREVQDSLVPKVVPAVSGLDIATCIRSYREVGGDFYDILPVTENRVLVSIADTSDKGLFACLYSLTLKSLLKGLFSTSSDLGDVVKNANNLFLKDTGGSEAFVTASFYLFDSSRRNMFYTNCGHIPALVLLNSGGVVELTMPGIAMGVEHLAHVDVSHQEFSPGDLLLLVTDGIIEAQDVGTGQFYGMERLNRFLSNCVGLSAQSVVDKLIGELSEYTQSDDMAIVVVRVT